MRPIPVNTLSEKHLEGISLHVAQGAGEIQFSSRRMGEARSSPGTRAAHKHADDMNATRHKNAFFSLFFCSFLIYIQDFFSLFFLAIPVFGSTYITSQRFGCTLVFTSLLLLSLHSRPTTLKTLDD